MKREKTEKAQASVFFRSSLWAEHPLQLLILLGLMAVIATKVAERHFLSVRGHGAGAGIEGERALQVDPPAESERPEPAQPAENIGAPHRGKSEAISDSSGQLFDVTFYSHGCILPRHGKERHARRAANGRWPIADKTIAADPSIPFGTELLIEGLGFRTVGDRGSAIKGRRIDVFVDSCREAREFGRRWLRVYPVPQETTREALW